MRYLIDDRLAQAIADYLVTKPYREVSQLVRGLEALQPEPEQALAQPGPASELAPPAAASQGESPEKAPKK